MKASSYIKFARKVKGTGWTPYMIRKKFLVEVDKADYSLADRSELFEILYKRASFQG